MKRFIAFNTRIVGPESGHPMFSGMLAGLQVVPVDSMVVDAQELTALESMACKYLETRRQQRVREGRA